MKPKELNFSEPLSAQEHEWLETLWVSEWGGLTMVSRGHVFHLTDLDSIVARDETGVLVGAATYRLDAHGGCELMSINAVDHTGGVGTGLLRAVEAVARREKCGHMWLITSNDNLDALRFYQRRGYRITAVYSGAIDDARKMKPTIPLVGNHAIEIHDEIELTKLLKYE